MFCPLGQNIHHYFGTPPRFFGEGLGVGLILSKYLDAPFYN